MARVVIAMSGGVDSSVAAHLLLRQGHQPVGVFMRHGEESPVACESDRALPIVAPRLDHKQGCCSASDAEDARRVADRLNIPFYALNLQREFGRIMDYFVDEYAAGRTPNPCVMCNNWIKFGRLFDYADSVGAQFVATGHYAQLQTSADNATPALVRGRDRAKDQSYVLFGIERRFLSRMLLPVGNHEKREIRDIAGQLGLRVAQKRDSQEICFVASGKHAEFVRARQNSRSPGEIVTTSGEVVGTHEGIEGFTIGQRKGLRVAMGQPRYVVRIEPASQRVVIGEKHELGRLDLTASRLNWLVDPPADAFRCEAQIRYNSRAFPAQAECIDDDCLRIVFDHPQDGVAPGQAVVLYRDDRVLGGGWIE